MKPKVCYVIPEYRSDTATHFAHVYDMVREISDRVSFSLVIERGARPTKAFGYSELRMAHVRWAPLRTIELLFILGAARLRGYRVFYVHYSFAAALSASVVTDLFGGSVLYWNCGEPWKYKRPLLRDWFERLVYSRVTLVTGAESLAKKYVRTYGIKRPVEVVPNSIRLGRFQTVSRDEARRSLDIPFDKKVVLYVHRLSSRKGADTVWAVAKDVIAKNPEALFIIVGEGPEQRRLKAKVEEGGLIEEIRIEGKIPNLELPAYFAAADIFFMPSEEEGFPRVILEAMSAGVPTVGSDVGAVREILPDALGRFLTEPGNLRGFAARIRELLKGPSPISPEELKEHVKRYDIKAVAERFVELFEAYQSK